MVRQRFCWRAATVTSMLRGGLCRRPAAMRDRSGATSVAVMMLVAFVLLFDCGMLWCCSMAIQRFCWRAATVTSMWRGGLCRRPAAMRDWSGTTSVAVVMLVAFVLLCFDCGDVWRCGVAGWVHRASVGVRQRSHRCGAVACVGGWQRCAIGARQCRCL
jgi:hypothetical protein